MEKIYKRHKPGDSSQITHLVSQVEAGDNGIWAYGYRGAVLLAAHNGSSAVEAALSLIARMDSDGPADPTA